MLFSYRTHKYISVAIQISAIVRWNDDGGIVFVNKQGTSSAFVSEIAA